MNPPLEIEYSPFAQRPTSQHQPHRTLQPASHPHHRSYHPRSNQSTATVIYDGFDFGFDVQQPVSRRRETAPSQQNSWPSPTLSSTSSGSSGSSSSSSSGSESRAGSEWGDAGVQGLTPRPYPAGMDEADYFIKRGGWKRRGIVFSPPGAAMASEDECFDLSP